MDVVKNGCNHSGHRTPKLAVSEIGVYGTNCFFAYWYKFRKPKSYFNSYRVQVVKYWHDVGSWTVKSAVSQEWIDELNWCCVCLCKFRKAKSNRYGVGVGKYEHGLLGHGTLRSALSQEWIDELSWVFWGFFACNDAVVFG